MNVLLLRANPRKFGYTQRLTDWLRQGLLEAGAELADVDLAGLRLNPCAGCYHCWVATPGHCIHDDDMPRLLEQVLDANVLICATPVYFYSMSSFLKIFFERTFPLAKPGITVSPRGLTRNSPRYPERWQGKKLVTLVAGALRDPEVFQPVNQTFQLIADSLELELGGQLTRPESYLLDFPLSKPKTLKLIETAFIEAGREIARIGRISPATLQAASLPLAVDLQHFRTYSKIYWECAEKLGGPTLLSADVQKAAGNDVRILMREMVRYLDPKAAARVRAVLQFEFPDQGLIFQVKIDAGRCDLTEGSTLSADLRVQCPSTIWASLFTRQLDVREALKAGHLVLTGDKSLFARLDRLFPPPSE